MLRKTIQNSISICGIGQYTGNIVNITLRPAKIGDGIFFKRIDIKDNNRKNIIRIGDKQNVYDTSHLNTKISNGEVSITMIEHIMSSLWALKITDIEIDIDNDEIPMFDGSAEYLIFLLRCAGIKDFEDTNADVLEIKKELSIKDGIAEITAKPCDRLKITLEIDFDVKTIGHDIFTFDENKNNYFFDIASARTFCTEEQVDNHMKLKKHFSSVDMVVFGDEKYTSNTGELNYSNEPTRHKILDLIGDLMNIGKFVKGEFICKKSGHHSNRVMIDKILAENN